MAARALPWLLVAALGCGAAIDSPVHDGSAAIDATTGVNDRDGGADDDAATTSDAAHPLDGGIVAGRDGGSGDAAPAGDGGACPADTAALPGFCMDRYEAPNQLGASPLAMQTAGDGIAWCQARGKRLCTEAEWVRACQGPSGRAYPYGNTYQRGTCTDDKTWISPNWTVLGTWPSAAAMAEAMRLYQADPSGSRPGCVSEEGVYDLTGNVAEWVTRSFIHATNYDQVMKGCYWAGCYGGSPPSCAFTNPAHPGAFRTYEGGFRCCLDR